MLMMLVLGDWPELGLHVNTPLDGLTEAPDGAPGARLNVRNCAGKSESVTIFVNVSNWLGAIVLLAIGERMGAGFTSGTRTMNDCVALKVGTPLSNTRTIMLLLLGPWASVGVHVNNPF